VQFNLGQIALDRGELGDALVHLGRSLAGSAPSDSITPKLHALIASCHQRAGDLAAALAAAERGLAVFADDAELLFRKAVVHRLRGEQAAAAACWRTVLTLRPPERFGSVDSGIYGHVTRRNLATLAEEAGDRAAAARLWREVLAERPGDAIAESALARLRPPVAEENSYVFSQEQL
jgi:predicted TPR repeat methyltransferase